LSDLYSVLGVERNATQDEIHRAYRHRAKISHPDSGGSVEAFKKLATAYDTLSDKKRRERYDSTGQVEPALPDNLDVNAFEVLAGKLGMIIHAEQDVTLMDIGAFIEQTIRKDITQYRADIENQRRAIERLTRLQARVKCKANGEDNKLARLLAWHELSAKSHIKTDEEAVCIRERALEILEDYSFADDLSIAVANDLSVALHDVLQALNQADQFQLGASF
jgi:curved DNA-binding protein CbpA